MIGRLYLEHLSDADLAALSVADDASGAGRRDPERIEALLDNPALFRRLFATPGRDPFLQGSPFLLFAVLIHRAARDLRQASFLEEWVGPRQRVPVFDVGGVREFAAQPMRRFFLAELLASYTKVASGTTLVKTSRGWRRRRFSELDPLRLVELAEQVPEADRPSVYRRLGDLSLFLSGIFPDYAGERMIVERERRRLELALGGERDLERGERHDGLWLLERLGRRAYWIAHRAAGRGSGTSVLADVSEHFAAARRLLNFLTDRYLFPIRSQWFHAE